MGKFPENRILEIFERHNVEFTVSLPWQGCGQLLDLLTGLHHVSLNREEEGVGICAGFSLAGAKSVMLIQSSGLGNSVNAIMSLHRTYHLPLPILATWRGVDEEKIPAQIPLGKALPSLLEALGISFKVVRGSPDVDRVGDVLAEAYGKNTPTVALISPRVWKQRNHQDNISFPRRSRTLTLRSEAQIVEPTMTRREAISVIASQLEDEAVISNIGYPSKELYSIKDRELNFYMLGSLGQASSIGLGLALKCKDREVFVLDGDGSLLTNPSILASIATEKPRNLVIFCLDNGTWGSTGDQLTRAYETVDLELVARAMGFEKTAKVQTFKELKGEIQKPMKGPRFVHILIKPGSATCREIPLTPLGIKKRFMQVLSE